MKEEKKDTTPAVEPAVVELVSLPLEVVNQVLSYLGTRPYQESAKLIVAIQSNAKQV